VVACLCLGPASALLVMELAAGSHALPAEKLAAGEPRAERSGAARRARRRGTQSGSGLDPRSPDSPPPSTTARWPAVVPPLAKPAANTSSAAGSGYAMLGWLIISHRNKPAISNQPTVLFSRNKPVPAISNQPNEHAVHPRRLSPACRQDREKEMRDRER
jgi:hypothetical protein